MWKAVVLAVAASTFLITPSEGSSQSSASSSGLSNSCSSVQCTGANEIWDPCPPNCPPQNCDSIGQKYFCPLIPANKTSKDCHGTCRCKPHYTRNKTGECIAEKDCPPVCGANEVLSQCSNGGCGPWTCADVGFPKRCVKMNEKDCTVGCVCKERFVREKGVCIPVTECTSCGGDSNAVPGCGINCGRLCSNYDKGPVACPDICLQNGCDCKKEFVFDEKIKKCVRPKDCTPVCGTDEVFSECVNGGCEAQNCSQLGRPVPCMRRQKCISGCLCKKGYLRADNGTCVPKDQCPNQNICGVNERLEQCPPWLCAPQSCKELGFPLSCPSLPDNSNTPCPGPPACVCDFNYVRDDTGKCIHVKQCHSCGGDPNAESGCGLNCGRLCSNYDKGPVPCPRICFPNSCDCKQGFVFDENIKRCVRPQQCTPVCKDNEKYSECVNSGCKARNCSQLGKPVPCAKINPNSCIKGCICEDGLLRASNGTCVHEKDCDHCNRPHEHYDPCAPSCPPQTCKGIGKVYHCPMRPAVCTGACRCDDGFLRNDKGECIPKEDCSPCGVNETLERCPKSCFPQTCAEVGFPVPCDDIAEDACSGPPVCVCIDNYVRDDEGKCIPIQNCTSCGGDPNAVSGCGVNCGRLCSNYWKKDVLCPFYCNLNGCDCRKDFVLDTQINKCVRPKDCTPICGKNEVYDTCANGGCDKRNCSQVDQPGCLCIHPKKCIGGCVCQKGFLRADDGICVPENQCPQKCPKPHEIYDPCPPTCPPQNCESIGKVYSCPAIIEGNCEGACRCEQGFYRNSIGECISEKDCLRCTGPNEYFSCGGACDNICATLEHHNKTNCPIIEKKCIDNCYCNEGYARDDNGVCIPIKQCGVSCNGDPNAVPGCGYCGRRCSDLNTEFVECPAICYPNCECKEGYVYDDNLNYCVLPEDCNPRCGPNEVYEENPSKYCEPRECSELGFPLDCADDDGGEDCEEAACVCKEDYVRDACGTCIHKTQCLSCGGDPNAVSGCGNKCGNTCSDYGKNVTCLAMCYFNACDCRTRFVYDEAIDRCVRYEDCSTTTKCQ